MILQYNYTDRTEKENMLHNEYRLSYHTNFKNVV